MVDRYGAAIEVDLHREYTLDLLDFFRGKLSWRKLNHLVRLLSSQAQTTEALANDEEVARQLMADKTAGGQPPADPGPRFSEYTATVARLDDLKDAIAHLTATVVHVAGGKPRPGRPAKRPETAFTRARQAQIMARHYSLLGEVAEAQARWTKQNNT